ncbi:MAG: hypothetical protein ACI9W1_002927 [Candidatus Azotimanducaceae bacterium]|jgi:hypothetical protein
MPSRLRFCAAGYPVHVLQRGHDRQLCFAHELDSTSVQRKARLLADHFACLHSILSRWHSL